MKGRNIPPKKKKPLILSKMRHNRHKSHIKSPSIQHTPLPRIPFHTQLPQITRFTHFFSTIQIKGESKGLAGLLTHASKRNVSPALGHTRCFYFQVWVFQKRGRKERPRIPLDTYRYGPRWCGNKHFDNHFESRNEDSPQHTPARERGARQTLTATQTSARWGLAGPQSCLSACLSAQLKPGLSRASWALPSIGPGIFGDLARKKLIGW